MARTKVSAIAPSLAGAAVVYTQPTAEGDAIRPGSILLVKNGSGSTITLTLVTGGTAASYAIDDPTVTVAAGAEKAVGGFSSVFPQPVGADAGWVYVNYSSVTSVTRAVIAGNR
jgi:hypothetical protein